MVLVHNTDGVKYLLLVKIFEIINAVTCYVCMHFEYILNSAYSYNSFNYYSFIYYIPLLSNNVYYIHFK